MLRDYVYIARPDHWFKNVFALPGFLLAYIWQPIGVPEALLNLVLGMISLCAIVSANYTINEYLDAEFDRHHPTKKHRPSARGLIQGRWVLVQYLLLALTGLGLAFLFQGRLFVASLSALLLMGVIYNVKPVRTKDKAYLDVLTEAINNPLRLLIGWAMVVPDAFPPSSILIAYWFGGAFLMAVKRFAEYRGIDDAAVAGNYRESFKHYDENRLLLSAFFYALNSVFFLAIFLIKYRIEFLLSYPLFAILFTWYLSIGLRPDSIAQRPEGLLKERKFIAFVVFLAIFVILLFFMDLPVLELLQEVITY